MGERLVVLRPQSVPPCLRSLASPGWHRRTEPPRLRQRGRRRRDPEQHGVLQRRVQGERDHTAGHPGGGPEASLPEGGGRRPASLGGGRHGGRFRPRRGKGASRPQAAPLRSRGGRLEEPPLGLKRTLSPLKSHTAGIRRRGVCVCVALAAAPLPLLSPTGAPTLLSRGEYRPPSALASCLPAPPWRTRMKRNAGRGKWPALKGARVAAHDPGTFLWMQTARRESEIKVVSFP